MSRAWPKGLPRSLDYPDGGIADLLAGCAAAYGDRRALVDGDLELTYAELNDGALRVAQGLRLHGLGVGSVVGLHLPNSAWFTVAYYGVLLSGAAVVPLNPTQPVPALRQQVQDSGAVAVFTHPTVAQTLVEAAAEVPRLRLAVLVPPTAAAPADTPAPEWPAGEVVTLESLLASPAEPATVVSGDAIAHLSFTGGTTGVPKAVRVLHRNLVHNVLQMACWRCATVPTADDRGRITLRRVPGAASEYHFEPGATSTIAIAPLFHAMGLVSQSISAVTGTTVVVFGRFDPAGYLDALERYRPHGISGAPALVHAMLAVPRALERDLSFVRVVTTGSAPMSPAAGEDLRRLFPRAVISDAYGLTEATMAVSSRTVDPATPAPVGSVGLPIFDTEIEIRGTDGIEVLPTGREGEVWVRGPQIADGYLDHPELTAGQFVDGWLRTGDLGRVDEEGWLFLVGRAKDMLIYKGYNVYPGPLEDVLREHHAVAQVAVVGRPDPEAGDLPIGFVVPKPGIEAGARLREDLIAHVAARVAPYQRVRGIEFVDAMPLSAAGKILKSELRRSLG